MPRKTAKNKEQIYDEQIFPLMAKVIEICRTHKIAHVCSFAIPNDADDGLMCTTCATEKAYDPPDLYLKCVSILMSEGGPSPLMINVRDKDGKVISSTAVLG